MFQIEDPDLSVACCCDHGPILAVRHELDREDVLSVTRSDGAGQLKLLALVGRLVCMNVQMLVVGPRGK